MFCTFSIHLLIHIDTQIIYIKLDLVYFDKRAREINHSKKILYNMIENIKDNNYFQMWCWRINNSLLRLTVLTELGLQDLSLSSYLHEILEYFDPIASNLLETIEGNIPKATKSD